VIKFVSSAAAHDAIQRLLALSFHADAITTEHWEDAKRLSEEVTRRFANEE